jgi:hypothetical protein
MNLRFDQAIKPFKGAKADDDEEHKDSSFKLPYIPPIESTGPKQQDEAKTLREAGAPLTEEEKRDADEED